MLLINNYALLLESIIAEEVIIVKAWVAEAVVISASERRVVKALYLFIVSTISLIILHPVAYVKIIIVRIRFLIVCN